jgi:hypothetical protein
MAGGVFTITDLHPQDTETDRPADALKPAVTDARALLDRLESAHASVKAFHSPLTYRKEYALEGDFETRIGEVALRGHGPDREIVLVFDRVIDADGHGTDDLRYHVYKDGWWTEINPGGRRILARQMQAPGSIRDPFELGEGPLPLPLGQKAEDVMKRFEVSLGDRPDDPVLRGIKDAHVLHLVPRSGTPAAEDIESIDLLYERESLLPVGLLVVDQTGDRTTAWLRSPESTLQEASFAGRAGEARALMDGAMKDPTWTVDRKPLPPTRDGANP